MRGMRGLASRRANAALAAALLCACAIGVAFAETPAWGNRTLRAEGAGDGEALDRDLSLDSVAGAGLGSHSHQVQHRITAVLSGNVSADVLDAVAPEEDAAGLPPLHWRDPPIDSFARGSVLPGGDANRWIIQFKPGVAAGEIARVCAEMPPLEEPSGLAGRLRWAGNTTSSPLFRPLSGFFRSQAAAASRCAGQCWDLSLANSTGTVFFSSSLDAVEGCRRELRHQIEFVEREMKSFTMAGPEVRVQSLSTALWGLDRIDQNYLPLDRKYHHGPTGQGVNLFILDTGIRYSHVDFVGRVEKGIDFIDEDYDPWDEYGHGTHISGTAAGTRYGVAKKAKIHPVRVLGSDGSGAWSGIIKGLDWIAKNHQKPAAAVLSLGGHKSWSVNRAVDSLVRAGVTVVVAAGNSHKNACEFSPASVSSAITVASTDRKDHISSFSNYGSCVDLFAPGTDILSAWNRKDYDSSTSSGTSMACPHVLGAVALHLENHPTATPAEVKQAILKAATRVTIGGNDGESPGLMLNVADLPCKQKTDCEAGPWGGWSECPSNTCGPRFQRRQRSVLRRQRCGGTPCALEEERYCGEGPACPPTAFATQSFSSERDFEMEYKTVLFRPFADNAYSACLLEDVDPLMERTDEGYWERLELEDDSAAFLDVRARTGKKVLFYGKEYDGLWVGSNGYITFGEPDSDHEASLAAHFSKPRVSVLFGDLRPDLGEGAVKYAFTPSPVASERLVVTFDHVKDYCTWWGCYGSNTGQVVFVLSGDRRGDVALSYRSISTPSKPVVVGLSPGGGVPRAFKETQLADLPAQCALPMGQTLLVSSILEEPGQGWLPTFKMGSQAKQGGACEVGEWGGWSECSKPCGGGYRERTREVAPPRDAGAGVRCPVAQEQEACNEQKCLTACDFIGMGECP